MRRTLELGFVVVLAGCGSAEEGPVATTGAMGVAEIYGGSAVTEEYQRATVSLHVRSSRSVTTSPFCSGTLIAPRWVLTAGHCVTGGGKKSSPRTIAVYVGDDPSADLADHLYEVSAVYLHMSYNAATLQGDVGLLRLSTEVVEVAPVPPLGVARGVTAADVGLSMDFVGFGYTESGGYGSREHVTVPMASMGCPTSLGCPAGYSVAPYTTELFAYSQMGVASAPDDDEGPCSGDSGGPAFVERDGDWYVAGVSSFGDAACRVYGASGNVSDYESWIEALTGELNGM